jgi:hypothetical protein
LVSTPLRYGTSEFQFAVPFHGGSSYDFDLLPRLRF